MDIQTYFFDQGKMVACGSYDTIKDNMEAVHSSTFSKIDANGTELKTTEDIIVSFQWIYSSQKSTKRLNWPLFLCDMKFEL